jgi:hypothetical protein
MGPTLGLIVLIFVVIAAIMLAALMLMPGWKSLFALLAVYAAVLAYYSFTPSAEFGQMGRATLGLGWLAFGLAAIVRIVLQVRRSQAKTTI